MRKGGAKSAKGGPAAAKKGTKGSKGAKPEKAARVIVSAEQIPRRSLEQALRVALALRDTLAGGPATWDEIAEAMKIGASNQNKYYLWSAQAYGIVQKEDESFSLSELGRKILAPTGPNEDREAKVQAVLTPVTFSRFFTDYNGSPFPAEEHIGNILERRYGVPRERLDEAKGLLRENGIFSGILQQQPDGSMAVRLDPASTGVPRGSGADISEPGAETNTSETSPASSVDFAKMCFIITPIGDEDSEERKHANLILKNVIEPVVAELGFQARRADQIDRAGIITQQIFECLAKSTFSHSRPFLQQPECIL